jgi:hypothetical protein
LKTKQLANSNWQLAGKTNPKGSNHKGHEGTQRRSSKTYAKLGPVGMPLVKPFEILVEGWGEGWASRSGDPVIGSSGDRKGKTLPPRSPRSHVIAEIAVIGEEKTLPRINADERG